MLNQLIDLREVYYKINCLLRWSLIALLDFFDENWYLASSSVSPCVIVFIVFPKTWVILTIELLWAEPILIELLCYSFIEIQITPPKMLLQQRLRLIRNRSCGILKKLKTPHCLNIHAEIQCRENIWWLTIKVYFIRFNFTNLLLQFITSG